MNVRNLDTGGLVHFKLSGYFPKYSSPTCLHVIRHIGKEFGTFNFEYAVEV